MSAEPVRRVPPPAREAPATARTNRARTSLGILALAFAVRLVWVSTLPETLTWDDEKEFAEVARHLVAGDGYVSESYRANPVLPVYLGVVFRVFGERYLVARIGQSAIGAATCLLVGRLATGLLGPAVGTLAAFLLALYPPHVYLAGVFYAENMATFFVALSMYLAWRAAAGRGSLPMALVTGVSLGVTALTRPIFLAVGPAVAAAWLYGASSTDLRRRLVLCIGLGLGAAATILPWSARNYRTYGRFIMISSGFTTKLWQGNSELSDGGPDDRELLWSTPDWQARLARLGPATRSAVEARYAPIADAYVRRLAELNGDIYLTLDEVLKPVVREEIRAHPLHVLGLIPKKVVTLFSAFSSTITSNAYTGARTRAVAALSFYPLLVLAVAGAVLGLPERAALASLYLVIASVTGAYALLNTCTRFRLPIDPYLIVFASLALVRSGGRVLGHARVRS